MVLNLKSATFHIQIRHKQKKSKLCFLVLLKTLLENGAEQLCPTLQQMSYFLILRIKLIGLLQIAAVFRTCGSTLLGFRATLIKKWCSFYRKAEQ